MMHLLLLLALFGCKPAVNDDSGSDPPEDADEDGYAEDVDCDDADAERHPDAEERCNGLDDDCDGALANGEADEDGDQTPDCATCDAAGLWVSTRDLTDPDDLKAVIYEATQGLSCGYSEAGDTMFLRIDNHSGTVECVYTGRTTTVTNQKPDPNTDMNIEHTWPQSEGADTFPAKCDIHHLYPTDVTANSKRADYPFGEVVSGITWSVGGSSLGKDASGQTVFEPRDVHKGNVARSMLYFAMRYQKTIPSQRVELFLEWDDQDPVDDAEWERTTAISEYYNHVNPYVACPDLVERIEGADR